MLHIVFYLTTASFSFTVFKFDAERSRLITHICKMTYDGLLHKIHGRAFDIKLFIIFFFNGIPNALITCTIVMLLYVPPDQHCHLPKYALDAITEVSFTFT